MVATFVIWVDIIFVGHAMLFFKKFLVTSLMIIGDDLTEETDTLFGIVIYQEKSGWIYWFVTLLLLKLAWLIQQLF